MKKFINKAEYRELVISSLDTDIDFTDIISDNQIKSAGYSWSDAQMSSEEPDPSRIHRYIDGVTGEENDIVVKEKDKDYFVKNFYGNYGTTGSTGVSGVSGPTGVVTSFNTMAVEYGESYLTEPQMREMILDSLKNIQEILDE